MDNATKGSASSNFLLGNKINANWHDHEYDQSHCPLLIKNVQRSLFEKDPIPVQTYYAGFECVYIQVFSINAN